jgi:hypothetical protein
VATITLADAAGRWAHLAHQHKDVAVRGLRMAALAGVQLVVRKIIPSHAPNEPVDTGAYRAGWKAIVIPDGAAVLNDNPIAPIIEYGVRPFGREKIGRKMLGALFAWLLRKGIADTPEEAQSMAWAVAMTLAEWGRPGLHIWRELNEELPKLVDREVTRALKGYDWSGSFKK